jgi:hypothetical protein
VLRHTLVKPVQSSSETREVEAALEQTAQALQLLLHVQMKKSLARKMMTKMKKTRKRTLECLMTG